MKKFKPGDIVVDVTGYYPSDQYKFEVTSCNNLRTYVDTRYDGKLSGHSTYFSNEFLELEIIYNSPLYQALK